MNRIDSLAIRHTPEIRSSMANTLFFAALVTIMMLTLTAQAESETKPSEELRYG